jgi:CHASE2 domain-containing sensor protein
VAGPEARVPQPVSLAGWEPPGAEPAAVLAHAQTVRTLLHGSPIQDTPLPAMLLAIAAAALIALVTASLAPVVGTLAAVGAAVAFLVALRLGWHAPVAGPLATIVAAAIASRLLGRRAPGAP